MDTILDIRHTISDSIHNISDCIVLRVKSKVPGGRASGSGLFKKNSLVVEYIGLLGRLSSTINSCPSDSHCSSRFDPSGLTAR